MGRSVVETPPYSVVVAGSGQAVVDANVDVTGQLEPSKSQLQLQLHGWASFNHSIEMERAFDLREVK